MDNHSILNDLSSMKSQPSHIMAMGVGGAGGNAVEHMWQMRIEGVNLAAANTDKDDLDKLHIPEENRIMLGPGLGAGNNSERGAELARGSLDSVRDLLIARGMARHAATEDGDDWDIDQLTQYLENLCIHPGTIAAKKHLVDEEDKEAFVQALKDDARAFYEERETLLSEIGVDMREFERVMLLGSVDRRWMDHIDAMDQLRDGIGFRAYSGKNPVTEYQIESGYMFDELNHLIREDTVRRVYQAKIQRTPERVQAAQPTEACMAGDGPREPRKVKSTERVGRNDPCPCGSGKKYKQCCGKNEQ